VADLLLHSLSAFQEIVLEGLRLAGARRVVEVGAEWGDMTRALLDYTEGVGGTLVSIDPQPSAAATRLLGEHPHAELVRDTSLAALATIDADAYVIDGDHNWYTVFHESQIVWERTRATGTPFLAFYHDVGWPWGRRDLYYDPARIPREHLNPHAWDRGVTLDHPGLIDGGFRGEGRWACAREEGGPKNGVLTAIEDFVLGKETSLAWGQIPAVFGLGVLFEKEAPWAPEMAAHLLPYHLNPLLERLERNRLECYLRVIALQDSRRAAVA
jgi:hypothetical protein